MFNRPITFSAHNIILGSVTIIILLPGIFLFFIPPAVFPDPGMGFQVLRCMHFGSGFNVFNSPDQSDISQNYDEFLTWWSPGQYLVPWFFKIIGHLNMGQGIAIAITLCQFCGLAGFYSFFKKIGFTPIISAFSMLFIICQQAFSVPFVYYNGGEILLFAMEGWFLYGCIALKKTNIALMAFALLSGWIGFFCKSSFIWIYAAGLLCLWIRLSLSGKDIWTWVIKGLGIALPAGASLAAIYVFFLSKGQSPASSSNSIKLTLQTFGFPLASPLLSGFSVDDMFHGLIYHIGKAVIAPQWDVPILIMLAIASMVLISLIYKNVRKTNYRLFLLVFYLGAVLFFGYSYLRQLNISMEGRHFRIIGILVTPGVIYLVSGLKRPFIVLFTILTMIFACININYLIKGFDINKNLAARGVTGIAQPNIDQKSLNAIMKLDRENTNATFVFISDDIGLEIMHNRIITLLPIGDDLKINTDDYRYDGHGGPLYIVLPESYNGPKEKMILKSFPGYKGFYVSMLSDSYVLYAAK